MSYADFNYEASKYQGYLRKMIELLYGENTDTHYRDGDGVVVNGELKIRLVKRYNDVQTEQDFEIPDDVVGHEKLLKSFFG